MRNGYVDNRNALSDKGITRSDEGSSRNDEETTMTDRIQTIEVQIIANAWTNDLPGLRAKLAAFLEYAEFCLRTVGPDVEAEYLEEASEIEAEIVIKTAAYLDSITN